MSGVTEELKDTFEDKSGLKNNKAIREYQQSLELSNERRAFVLPER